MGPAIWDPRNNGTDPLCRIWIRIIVRCYIVHASFVHMLNAAMKPIQWYLVNSYSRWYSDTCEYEVCMPKQVLVRLTKRVAEIGNL